MTLRYKLTKTDGSEEIIDCAGFQRNDGDTIAFFTLSTAVNAQGKPAGEVFLIMHWSDIKEIRKIEIQNGPPHLALAT